MKMYSRKMLPSNLRALQAEKQEHENYQREEEKRNQKLFIP